MLIRFSEICINCTNIAVCNGFVLFNFNVCSILCTANSVNVVFSKAWTVNYERARDVGLLFI